jgi:hypothetical protein
MEPMFETPDQKRGRKEIIREWEVLKHSPDPALRDYYFAAFRRCCASHSASVLVLDGAIKGYSASVRLPLPPFNEPVINWNAASIAQ